MPQKALDTLPKMAVPNSSQHKIVGADATAMADITQNESKQQTQQQQEQQQQNQNGQLPRSVSSPSPSDISQMPSSQITPSPSSSQIKTRAVFGYPARIIQKAIRKVSSVFTPGKTDITHQYSPRADKRSTSHENFDSQSVTMTMNGGVSLNDRGLSNVTNVAAMSRLPDDIEALKLKENTQPSDLSAASDINNDGPDDSSPVCPDDTSEALSTRLSFAGSTHSFAPLRPLVPLGEAGRPTRTPEEDAVHEAFTQAALEMARLALRTNETPVGCVLVHKGKVIAKGMNATNVTRNGTRHAEFMAVCSLLGQPAEAGGDVSFVSAAKAARAFHEANQARKAAEAAAIAAAMLAADVNSDARSVISATTSISSLTPSTSSSTSQAAARVKVEHEGVSEDVVSKSYLYPYGQKWWPEDKFNPDIFHECTLYVTVEPCVMCASFLRQLGIQKVFFGAVNDKFGGTGGVFNIHKNCQKLDETQLAQGTDGGPVGRGYDVEGGWGRNEAVALLRRFYVQENGRAPVPRKKEGRAARLAALEQVNGITVGEVDAGMISSLDDTTVGTPMTISSI